MSETVEQELYAWPAVQRSQNGLSVTYGHINAPAGDFYGTKNPISDDVDVKEQSKRFIEAYDTLAGKRCLQPAEAKRILKILQTEIDFVDKAVSDKKDPSIVYHELSKLMARSNIELAFLTLFRPPHIPSYVGLALINFGEDARTACNAGHSEALEVAASGNLERAYALNAFADHFLEDSFLAGHLRTPRRGLHRIYVMAMTMNRRMHNFASDWEPEDTPHWCKKSGWWKYPITIDGPPRIIPEVSDREA